MDSTDRLNLIQHIISNVNKYDSEGRRVDLTAEETVEYAKILVKFIDDIIEGEDDEF